MAERLVVQGDQARHVQAYVEYRNLVGSDDGGRMMSEAEYEEYKRSDRAR